MNGGWTALVAFVAIIGWFATHLLHEARERRKETRAQLNASQQLLWELAKQAKLFHRKESFCEIESFDLLSDIQRVFRSLRRLQALPSDAYKETTINLRQAITLQNFDKSGFSRQQPSSTLLAEIDGAAQDLDDALEDAYVSLYPSRFPYFKIGNRKELQAKLLRAQARSLRAWNSTRDIVKAIYGRLRIPNGP